MTMLSRLFSRATRVVLAAALLVAFSVQFAAAAARPEPGARRPQRGFNLFAEVFTIFLVNRVACGINNLGEVCVDPGNSPIGGGGFWPRGTPDQYIFNSGLQIAGVIPAGAGFEWAGDTTGAFFMDPRGTQSQGDGVTPVYNSLDPVDAQDWPNGGIVRDTAVYADVLIGRTAVSQQDLWVRSWDGNPNLLSGRTHPMGVLVEMRGMAWNFPSGNEDILYFVYTFYNVTASNPAVYANLDPAIQGEIAQIGAQYQQGVQQTLGVNVPDDGYAIENLYAAFFMDPDVEDASHNYSTAVLPFQLAAAYKNDFTAPTWEFPANIFGPPFAPAPGFVGVKYLQSPVNPATSEEVGLTIFSNTNNAPTGFPDPVGVIQMWRYLSGNASPAAGDNPCTVTDPQARQLCYLEQQDLDTRFFMSSGPFTLEPGQSGRIVVAYVHAAPVAAWVEPGTDLKPGIPPNGVDLAAGNDTIRTIDRAVGWVSHADANLDGEVTQDEVAVVPRSLLDKSLVAQAVFDNKFLLPFAPEPPTFHLVPGHNQVAVVWGPSPTETVGDPYYDIASQDSVRNPQGDLVANALFDPNFRQLDVEGYRIYRGRTAGALELVAQFDYAGTEFIDYTGDVHYGNCAPELGLLTDCPVAFDFPISNSGPTNTVDISSPFIQVPRGGRVILQDGSTVLLVASDTASVGRGSGFPELTNSGVPFAFVDRSVRNSLTYFYAVTAFDFNSINSGPSILESAPITKSVTPRAPSPTERQAELISGLFGDDDVQLDPGAPWSIDPETGRFSGSPPPTDALEGVFAPLVQQLLPALSLEARIDSLIALNDATGCTTVNALGACYIIHLTFNKDGVEQQFAIEAPWPVWSQFGESSEIEVSLGNVPVEADAASAARFGVPAGFSTFNATVSARLREYIRFSAFEGQAARRNLYGDTAGFSVGGSRWFQGADETTDHPTYSIRVGSLPGVDTIWAPIHHTDTDPLTPGNQQYGPSGNMQCFGYLLGGLGRQADVQITWGPGGTIAGVRDITHHVDIPYKPTYQPSYGFVTDGSGNGVIDWRDFFWVDGLAQGVADGGPLDFCNFPDPGAAAYTQLQEQPTIGPVTTSGASIPSGTATGQGFGLYIDGERYIFQLTDGAPPADGTVWTLRTYAGLVDATTGVQTTTPAGYRYRAVPRPPIIPGLRVVFNVDAATAVVATTDSSLDRVHTVPDPYYVTSPLEITANRKALKFVNLPPQAIIRIYSLSGVLVNLIEHNDPTYGGEATWNLRNRNDQFVASGVYFYHVETPEGLTKVGRFTVVNFAQ